MKIYKLHNGTVLQKINDKQWWNGINGVLMNIVEVETLRNLMVDEKTKQQITKILQENK